MSERTLNDDDLAGFARRVANFARESLEARDRTWVWLPSFADAVQDWALSIMKTVVIHERQQFAAVAKDVLDELYLVGSVSNGAADKLRAFVPNWTPPEST
jgi:hypothetical protein